MTQLQPFDATYTDLMTVEQFVNAVRLALFLDEDGSGYYGTPTHYDHDAPARPSDIVKGLTHNNGYGYVHWFNK
jgi:hypothetical protein